MICPRAPSQPWNPAQRARFSPWLDGVAECSWPRAPGGTPTRAIYAAALGGRCRPWLGRVRWLRVRSGLTVCHEHDDCRRALALGVACAEDPS